jgi:uncharacterized protein YkwD
MGDIAATKAKEKGKVGAGAMNEHNLGDYRNQVEGDLVKGWLKSPGALSLFMCDIKSYGNRLE